MKNIMEVNEKFNVAIPFCPTFPLLDIYSKEMIVTYQREDYMLRYGKI
jgi:hypothetical protein